MLNHQASVGPNHMESPGNLLQQQQQNFDVQVSDEFIWYVCVLVDKMGGIVSRKYSVINTILGSCVT